MTRIVLSIYICKYCLHSYIILHVTTDQKILFCSDVHKLREKQLTLQEMCCGFWLSRERWYRKSVVPSTGAG